MKKRSIFLILVLMSLLLASLACSKAGQIVSIEEATAIAEQTEKRTGLDTSYKNAEGSVFIADDIVSFYAGDDVDTVPVYKDAGDNKPFTEVATGTSGKVDSSVLVDGEVWYKILSPVANGYVTIDGLKDSSDGGETMSFEVGDTPYLNGISYLVQLFDSPGSLMARIQQERGVMVEITMIEDLDGVSWYFVDSPAGQGWVTADSLSVDPIE
jgi:hypothetical protein